MELADPTRSYAVLIGSSSYADPALENLPAVANNLARLGELLQDPTVWGLPPDRCVLVPEPTGPAQVLDAVHDAAGRAEDTLLVYYAGHGLSDSNGLLLTLPTTDPQRPYTAVDFDAVRREVLTVRRDAHRIVILDCCYSGSALTGGMGGGLAAPVEMAEQTRIAGSYLLTASAATRQALAPPGETYTAFTGELIRLLDQGLPGGDTLIEITRVYERLHGELRAKGRPLPQQRLSNTGRTLAIARNRYGAAPTTPSSETLPSPAPVPVAPRVPEELKAVLRAKPRVIADEYARRRAHRDGRGGRGTELLRFAGALRPPQEVAALIALITPDVSTNEDSWRVLLEGVVARGPQAIVDCLDALDALDGAEGASDRLVEVAAVHPPEPVVGAAQAMRAAGYQSEADRLLSLAVSGHLYTEYIVELLGILWSAELNADADRVLAEATTDSDEDAVRFADALLAIGRREKAFELYARAAAVVVRRPMGELTHVLEALDEAEQDEQRGRHPIPTPGTGDPGSPAAEEERMAGWLRQQQQADTLLRAAVEAAESPSAVAELSEALWSAGMNGRALTALAQSAESLDPDAVAEVADVLRENGHEDGVRHLLRAATLAHPVVTTPFFVDALRDMGWPVDANRLLAVAAVRSAEDVAALAVWFTEHDRARDRARLVSAVERLPVVDRLKLLKTLLAIPGDHDDFIAPVALAESAAFTEALDTLRTTDDASGLVTLLAHQVRVDRPGALRRLDFLIRSKGAFGIEKAVLAALLASGAAPDDEQVLPPSLDEIGSLVGTAAPMAPRIYATSALCAAGQQGEVITALSRFVQYPATQETVEWLVALDAHSLPDCVRALIRSRRLAGGNAPGLADLVAGLAAADMRDAATFALQRFAFTLGPERTSALARSIAPAPMTNPYAPPPPFPSALPVTPDA